MTVFLLALLTPAFPPPNLEEIQTNVLESRAAIHSGEIEIVEKKKTRKDAQTPFEETSFTWKIAKSGDKTRGEFLTHKGFREGIRKIAAVNGDLDGWAFFHEALPNAAAIFGPGDKAPTFVGKKGVMWFAADFQFLGTMPGEIVQSYGSEVGSLLTDWNLNRFPFSIKEENQDSEKRYRFLGSCQPAIPISSIEFSVLPQQGWLFDSIRVWGKDFDHRLEVKNQKVDGIWFPKTMKFQAFDNGVLMTDEEVTIQVKSLNKPIPGETFQIRSLKLKDPTFVCLPQGEMKIWTKGKFITYDEYRATAKPRRGDP